MAKKGYNLSANVECPFFHFYCGSKIMCEGIESDSTTHLAFASIEKRRRYMESICYTNYKSCKLCQMLYKKYDK